MSNRLTVLKTQLINQMRAVVDAEVLFGVDSVQHKRQVAKMVRLQNQHAKAMA